MKEYPELLHLEIRANRFKSIPAEFLFPKLQKLYMGGNLIKEVNLHDLRQLQVLHLRGNRIASLSGLANLPLLSYLNLRYVYINRQNKIEKIQTLVPLETLPQLKVLILAGI